ncbi:hypothetical protein [Thalassospira profundimaris]|uniref:hypothetical protein n=1 Tax=Thalassospira profundimaris TaxID=502049 RepID=UPI0011BEA7F0|nr:hypothetical protein [Thalassospira profundimaris]
MGKVYTLGPTGTKVGFAYQQSRAFALATEFSNSNASETKNKAIAVIGAGVGGLTLACALLAVGYPRVSIIEKYTDVLADQAESSHRLVHPSYNSWPLADTFSSTTDFPFFNWYAGPCKSVIRGLRKEWELNWKSDFSERFIGGTTVSSISVDEEKVIVRTLDCNEEEKERQFDVVFVATGFGEENGLLIREEGQPTKRSVRYWDHENLQRYTLNPKLQQFLCIGTGDGALIDCARLAYKTDVFELASELMGALSLGFSDNSGFHKRDPSTFEEFIRDSEVKARTTTNYHEQCKILDEEYRKFVSLFDVQVNNVLSKGLFFNETFYKDRKIVLCGKDPTPFNIASTPINKIILAYMLKTGAVSYQQGEVSLSDDDTTITAINFADDQFNLNIYDFDYVVVRIGASPPVHNLCAPSRNAEQHPSSTEQQKLSDMPHTHFPIEDFLRLANGHRKAIAIPKSEKRYQALEKKIDALVHDISGGRKLSSPRVVLYKEHPRQIALAFNSSDFFDLSQKKMGGVVSHLFGVPVKVDQSGGENVELSGV